MILPKLLTMEEVAKILHVPKGRAYALARHGIIPGIVCIGRQRRVNAAILEAWIRNGGSSQEIPSHQV